MKKPQIIGASVVLLLLLLFIASPFMALNSMKTAAIKQDGEKLTEMIDFSSVRQSIKDQVNASMAKELASSSDGNPFAALGAMFASSLIDGIVDAMITPVGLQSLFSGNPSSSNGAEQSSVNSDKILKNAEFKYNSLNKFTVSVKADESGQPVKLILRREGLSWKLSEIIIPM